MSRTNSVVWPVVKKVMISLYKITLNTFFIIYFNDLQQQTAYLSKLTSGCCTKQIFFERNVINSVSTQNNHTQQDRFYQTVQQALWFSLHLPNKAIMKYVQMHRDRIQAIYFITRRCIEYPAHSTGQCHQKSFHASKQSKCKSINMLEHHLEKQEAKYDFLLESYTKIV